MDDIEKLLSASRGDNLDARLKAVTMLGRTGDARAVEPLIALLQDSSMSVRETAACALGEIRDVRAVGPLCSILSAYSDGHAAAVALVKIGAPAVEQVAAILAGKPDIIKARETAAEVLGLIGDIRAIGPLIAALHFPVGLVWDTAQAALVRIGAPAVEPLTAALRDGNKGAAAVLVRIGTPAAMEALASVLEDEKEEVRWAAALALAEVGSGRAAETLIGFLKSTSTWTHESAAKALGKISDVRVVEPLIAALGDVDPEVQKAAEGALMSLRTPVAAVAPLISLLHDTKQKVRYVATAALCNAGIFVVEVLIDALKDKNENVRKAAARALGGIGDTRAVEPLRAVALGDQDLWVRKESEAALKKLGWRGQL